MLRLHFKDLNRGLAADVQADLLGWVRKAPAGEICTFECQSQRADGDRFWSEVILKSAMIGGKKRLLSIERDISDRKRTETDLQQAKEAAEAANRAKSTFLANMSHELRTPLNAILGFAQLLAYDPHLNAEQKEELMIISRSGEHLLELINDILDLSKIEAGRLTLNESCFNLHRFLDGLEKMLQLKAESKGLQFIFQLDPNLPPIVQTDESKLRQVLINLLGNAIKFTEQGQVVLRVWAEHQSLGPPPAEHNDSVCVHPHGTAADPDLPSPVTYYLSFAVEDTGHGIAPAELASLFNAFVQTETGRRSQQGSGLGLAISRQFVQLMGGEISVQSQLGQGSCFYFYIPVSVTETTTLPSERPLVRTQDARVDLSAEERCYRMLVVDDHWESRKLLVKLLGELGFEVREAINGEEAIGRWQHWHPHLIWMDVRMPDMSGYEVTQRIRRREQRQQHQPHATPMSRDPHPATATCVAPPLPPATKIIALTASAFSDEHTQAIAAGCDDLIRKPFRRATVLEKLHQHLGVQFFETTASLPYEEVSLESASPASQATPILAAQSTREWLQTMPSTWIESLRQAAMQVNARKLMKLIEAVPPEQTDLAQVLTEMVDNFRFDQIIDLSTMAQPHGKSTP